MNLTGDCLDLPECGLIPEVLLPKVITLDEYSIHLKAKGGVAHQAVCHANEGYPGASPLGVTTNLVITAN